MRSKPPTRGDDRTVLELLGERVAAAPDAVAAVDQMRQFTYSEVWDRSDAFSRGLSRAGVGQGDTVGIALERSVDAILIIIAALRLGACYAAVEPGWPPRWIAATWSAAKPTLVVGRPSRDGRTRTVDAADLLDTAKPRAIRMPRLYKEMVMAVVCTSGSTGRPKAVAIPHRSVVNRVRWMAEVFGFVRSDVAALHRSMSLVSFPAELFGPLIHGVPLAVIGPREMLEPDVLWQRLARERVSILRETPASSEWLLRTSTLRSDTLPALRLVHVGGDTVRPALLQRWRDAFPSARLVHGYGCTEYSVIASCEVTAAASCEGGVPLGAAPANTTVAVLDRLLRPVPDGTIGEICVAGDGMAVGYRDQPASTSDRFIAHPSQPGQRLFRTGDRGWRRPDGLLAFAERGDRQVKVRGFRVEPGAVETALCGLRGVRQAAVVPVGSRKNGLQLAAFVVGEQSDLSGIRRALLERLPAHLVPHTVTRLSALPLAASGKVDARALRALARSGRSAPQRSVRTVRRPRHAVLQILESACQTSDLRLDRSFLESGGDSLAALTALVDIQRIFKVRLELSAFLDGRPLSVVADAVERAVTARALPQNGGIND